MLMRLRGPVAAGATLLALAACESAPEANQFTIVDGRFGSFSGTAGSNYGPAQIRDRIAALNCDGDPPGRIVLSDAGDYTTFEGRC